MEQIIEAVAEQIQEAIDVLETSKLRTDDCIERLKGGMAALVGEKEKLRGWAEGRKPRGSGEIK